MRSLFGPLRKSRVSPSSVEEARPSEDDDERIQRGIQKQTRWHMLRPGLKQRNDSQVIVRRLKVYVKLYDGV